MKNVRTKLTNIVGIKKNKTIYGARTISPVHRLIYLFFFSNNFSISSCNFQ